MSRSKLQVTLFGAPGFFIDDQQVSGFPSSKVAALGYFLAATGRDHTRDALAALLWPDYGTAQAKKLLRGAIYHLRVPLDAYLNVSRNAVGFVDDGSVHVDALHFADAVDRAIASRDDDQHGAALREAVENFHGDFLAGFHLDDSEPFDEWMRLERQRYQHMAVHAYSVLLHQALAANDALSGIKYATQLLTLDPLDEETYRGLMLLLAQDNRPSAALEQFERYRRLLMDELGVEPDDETIALAARIRDGELSGLRFVQPPAPRRRRHNLPAELTPFIGRESELATLHAAFQDPAIRLVTIAGVGGAGKSRLALHFGSRLVTDLVRSDEADADTGEETAPAEGNPSASMVDGVYWVRLAAIEADDETPRRILAAVAAALGIDFADSVDIWAQFGQLFTGRRLLLILDNYEQLQDHADVVVQMLQQAPELRLLVTSRMRLNVRGERIVALDGLMAANGTHQSDRWQVASQLFVATATAASPGFVADDDDRLAIDETCQLLHGLPLGIELAAGWTRLLSCREIAVEIRQNLDFLDSSQPDLPARHRSLRAVFEQSWRLLSADERRVMRSLSLFRGGFTRAGAEAVAGAALPILLGLLDKSLIRRLESDKEQPVRYEQSEVVRQYAAERLRANGEEDVASAALADYFTVVLKRLDTELRSGDQLSALQQIEDEEDNLRALFLWAVANCATAPAHSLPFLDASTGALFGFLDIRGRFREGAALFGDAVDALRAGLEDAEHNVTFATVLARYGWFLFHVGRHAESEAALGASLRTLEILDEPQEQTFALNYLAAVLRHVGRSEEALGYLDRAAAIRSRRPDDYSAGVTETIYAQVVLAKGDLVVARQHCERALNYKRLCHDRRGRFYALDILGRVHLLQDEQDLARGSFAEALDIAEEMDDPRAIATAQLRLGTVAAASGQLVGARRQYELALTTVRRIGSLLEASVLLTRLAELATAQQRAAEAVPRLQEALHLATSLRAGPTMATALLGSAGLFSAIDDSAGAERLLGMLIRYPFLGPEERRTAGQLVQDLSPGRSLPSQDDPLDVDQLAALADDVTVRLTALAVTIA